MIFLAYHRIENLENDPLDLAITPAIFEQQLKYLLKAYDILSVKEAIALLESSKKLKKSVAVLTFDDGYNDFLKNAYPLLKKYHIPATVFISPGVIEDGAIYWWDKVIEVIYKTKEKVLDLCECNLGVFKLLDRTQKHRAIKAIIHRLKKLNFTYREKLIKRIMKQLGIESIPKEKYNLLGWEDINMLNKDNVDFGLHGMTHTILTNLTAIEKDFEIKHGMEKFEQKVGKRVEYFAYPNGLADDYDKSVMEYLEKYGFIAAFTLNYQSYPKRRISNFEIGRKYIDLDSSKSGKRRNSEALFAVEVSGMFDYLFLRNIRN